MNKLKFIDMTYYILRKDGAYAGVSLWEGSAKTKLIRSPFMTEPGARKSTVSVVQGHLARFPAVP